MAIIDFAIIAALPEEFRLLRERFPDAKEVLENFTWYRTRSKSRDGKNYEVVLAHQNQMGPLDAHLLTQAVIARWDPAHIILVGIAGSFHEQVRLGDVVVSQQVFYYDPGKAAAEGKIKYRPEGYPCSVSLVRQVHAVTVDPQEMKTWQSAATKRAKKKARALKTKIPNDKRRLSAQKSLEDHKPLIHVGSVASGSLVISDEGKKAELLQLHGKLLGTEMEGAGCMHAAFFYGDSPRSGIVMKGISDTADKRKSELDALDFWRQLAGENSVNLALSVIDRGKFTPTLADQFDVDLSLASPAEVRSIIPSPITGNPGFLGFTGLVRPKGPITGIDIRVMTTLREQPVRTLQAVLLCHKDGKPVRYELAGETPVVFETMETLDLAPMQLYLMTQEAPDKIAAEIRGVSKVVTKEFRL